MPAGWTLPGKPAAAVATVGDEWMENEEQWKEKEELRKKLIEEERLAEEEKKKNLARQEKAWQERRRQCALLSRSHRSLPLNPTAHLAPPPHLGMYVRRAFDIDEEKDRTARLNETRDRKNRLDEMARGMPRWREWTRAPGQRLVRNSKSPPGFISSSDMLFSQPRPATTIDSSSPLEALTMGSGSNAFSSAMQYRHARPAVHKHVRQRPAFALDGPAFALPPTPKQAP